MKLLEILACILLGVALRGRLPAAGALAVYLAGVMLLHHFVRRRLAVDPEGVAHRLKVLAALRLVLLGALAGAWGGLQLTALGVPVYALLAAVVIWLPVSLTTGDGMWTLRRRLQLAFQGETRALLAATLAGALVRPDLTLWLATQAGMALLLSLPWVGLLWGSMGTGQRRRGPEGRPSRLWRSLCRIAGASLIGSLPLVALLTDWHPIAYLLATLAFVLAGSPWRTPRKPQVSRTPPPPPCDELPRLQVAAIILMSFPPELSAQIFKELGPEAVQGLTLEITRLSQIRPEVRETCMQGFLRSADWHHARSTGSRLECQADYENLIRNWPAEATRVLRAAFGIEDAGTIPAGPRPARPSQPSRPLAPPQRTAGGLGWLARGAACGVVAGLSLYGLAGQTRSPFTALVHLIQPTPAQAAQQRLQRFLDSSVGRGRAAVGVTPDGCVLTVTGDPALAESVRSVASSQLPAGVKVSLVMVPEREGLDYSLPLGLTGLVFLLALAVARRPEPRPEPKPPAPKPLHALADMTPMLPDEVPLLAIEMGPNLSGLVNDAKLAHRLVSLRRHVNREHGLLLPAPRVAPNPLLNRNTYVIKLRGSRVAQGELRLDHFLAIGPEEKLERLPGDKTIDPTYGMPGRFIQPDQRGDAERLGCMLFDPLTVLATQLTEVVRAYAADLLGFQELDELLQQHLRQRPALQHAVDAVGRVKLRTVLRKLLAEEVSIRDLPGIVELLAEQTLRPDLVYLDQRVEEVRYFLRRTICQSLFHSDRPDLRVMSLDCSPDHPDLRVALAEAIHCSHEEGCRPILLCKDSDRSRVSRLVRAWNPTLAVLSHREVDDSSYEVRVITAVTCSRG